ncbi:MAG TPA: hypothetical protein VMV59_10045 [Candidatus Dormibacteraeota bacterium]|nr:hypothetical protein [Candidatus Dormibacteraeota bacterium]
MAQRDASAFWGGAGLVWRRQRVLWWIFAVNFILAFFSIHGVVPRIGNILDHSLAAQRLVNGFDLGAFSELMLQPGISPLSVSPAAMAYSLVFFVFMLFVTGGILEVYRRDSRVSTAEFFESSGAFFWRFVRLLIFLVFCMIPVAIFDVILRTIGNHIDERAISAMTIVWFRIAAGIVLLFLLMVLRLWFDMAEVHSVAQNERRMRRSLAVAWRLTFGNFGRLFWLYFSISVVACVGFGFGLWLWLYVLPPTAITGAFFLSQAMILWWLATRLWQRSAETLWYQRNFVPAAPPALYPPATYPVVAPQTPLPPLPPPSSVDQV